MIKDKGIIQFRDGYADLQELHETVEKLPQDQEYGYIIFDKKQNRSLPQLKYLFGHVLKSISDQLPDHPPVDALYRYFEEIYAPIHVCKINGEVYEYFNLKNEKSIEMNDVITQIIHHATKEWGLNILTKDELKSSEAQEAYASAYAEMWDNYSRKL